MVATVPAAAIVSWFARRLIRRLVRRAVMTAQQSPGMWRVRLERVGERHSGDERKIQRADAAARMLGHYATALIFTVATFIALDFAGTAPLTVLSGAGFLGVALAFGGQDLIQNVIAGTMALLEDRYAVGDEVVLTLANGELTGTIDLIGAASLRLRTTEGVAAHVGHNRIQSMRNLSQMTSDDD